VGEFVLRCRPPDKIVRSGIAGKYSSWWRGPFEIVKVIDSQYLGKKQYRLLNLVTNNESNADVTHLKPFYYDPAEVTPLSVALRDTAEQMVEGIVGHRIDPTTRRSFWLVHWEGEAECQATWEPHSTVKDVEKFHVYCFANNLEQYLPAYLTNHTSATQTQSAVS
jgi:hypothetical protein